MKDELRLTVNSALAPGLTTPDCYKVLSLLRDIC